MRLKAIQNLYPLMLTTNNNELEAYDKDGSVIVLNENLISEEIISLETLMSKDIFYTNRATIMDSIGWIHERIQSQTVLIQGGKTLTASYTTAEAIEYYDYKQSLRDRPSIITDWTSISYPVVPQQVYNDMTDAIKALCQELQCDPVV